MFETKELENKQDFEKFLYLMLSDYNQNSESWENNTLESFLNAMVSWLKDAEGYYENIEEPEVLTHPSWRLFADMLIAARIYE
ncbi:DUF7660 family protein [Suttonella ornithocola]|uniref:DUF7660 domain-containing protein n=1 Tax=Suttonella ornithocola TaxID=279832 RepID=A0A380N0V5_9GAMM|nr:hypothetical protein [Suttonella ornithocola]SUO97387.1 Uncharacterised protein [Suttonella ornithocola]